MTKTANNKNKIRMAALALLGFGATLAFAVPAGAENGSVVVTATSANKLTISLETTTSDFGTNLDPDGTTSNGNNVAAYSDPNGAYYVKKGDASFAQTVTVKSNKAWNGSVAATENTGAGASPDITIGNGSLKWKSGNMTNFSEAQGGTAFTTGADSSVFGSGNKLKGVYTYDYDYSLRVKWTDDPGTFSSTVTYTAAQQ